MTQDTRFKILDCKAPLQYRERLFPLLSSGNFFDDFSFSAFQPSNQPLLVISCALEIPTFCVVQFIQGHQSISAFGTSVHVNDGSINICGRTLIVNIVATQVRKALFRNIGRDTNILPVDRTTLFGISTNKSTKPTTIVGIIFQCFTLGKPGRDIILKLTIILCGTIDRRLGLGRLRSSSLMNRSTLTVFYRFGCSSRRYSFSRGFVHDFAYASKGSQSYICKESLIKATKTQCPVGFFHAGCRAVTPNSKQCFQTVLIVRTHTFQTVN